MMMKWVIQPTTLSSSHTNTRSFLSNSTGCNVSKAKLLSQLIGVEILPEEVIMAQSPVAELFEQKTGVHHNKRVLLVSSNNGKGEEDFARMIGCDKNFTTCNEIDKLFPNLDWMDRSKWPASVDTSPRIPDSQFRDIECIVLVGEPVGWERNIQIVLDVILGKGHPNKRVEEYPNIKNEIPIIAANLDLCWKGAANMPRFGNGAFLLILETLYEKFTGNRLKYEKLFGKPSHHTYTYCLKRLAQLYPNQNIETIIGIGDNPQSDIAGANNIKINDPNHTWLSVLVETGVYKRGENDGQDNEKCLNNYSDETESCTSSSGTSMDGIRSRSITPEHRRVSEKPTVIKPNTAHREFLDISTKADYICFDLFDSVQKFT